MERKMFGQRLKKRSDTGRVPGEPFNDMYGDVSGEKEDSNEYVKSHDTLGKGSKFGRSRGGPKGYEGREHVKYNDPGYSSHEIRFPEDEPHMKSRVSPEEEHEMEDTFHQDVPDQTHYELQAKIKRARMGMDSPTQQDPKPLRGNLVNDVGYKGVEDTSGEEEMGPNDMQRGSGSKDHRKKMIVAVTRKKMKKNHSSKY